MIPLLALGLPGGALTAMMMGVFQPMAWSQDRLFLCSPKTLSGLFSQPCSLPTSVFFSWLHTNKNCGAPASYPPFHLLAPGILLIATVGAYGLRIWLLMSGSCLLQELLVSSCVVQAIPLLGSCLGWCSGSSANRHLAGPCSCLTTALSNF